jgi:hypothetical protein
MITKAAKAMLDLLDEMSLSEGLVSADISFRSESGRINRSESGRINRSESGRINRSESGRINRSFDGRNLDSKMASATRRPDVVSPRARTPGADRCPESAVPSVVQRVASRNVSLQQSASSSSHRYSHIFFDKLHHVHLFSSFL